MRRMRHWLPACATWLSLLLVPVSGVGQQDESTEDETQEASSDTPDSSDSSETSEEEAASETSDSSEASTEESEPSSEDESSEQAAQADSNADESTEPEGGDTSDSSQSQATASKEETDEKSSASSDSDTSATSSGNTGSEGASEKKANGSTSSTSNETPKDPDTLLTPGRFEVGTTLSLLWSIDSSTPENGSRATNSTLFTDSGIYIGYMFTERFQLRFQAGWLHVNFANAVETIQETNAASMVLQGLYHLPVGDIIALYGGGGAGGYVGETSRQISGFGSVNNPTNGFMATLIAGGLVELSPVVAIRSGIKMDFLAGRETPEPGVTAIQLQARDTLNVKALGFIEVSGKI